MELQVIDLYKQHDGQWHASFAGTEKLGVTIDCEEAKEEDRETTDRHAVDRQRQISMEIGNKESHQPEFDYFLPSAPEKDQSECLGEGAVPQPQPQPQPQPNSNPPPLAPLISTAQSIINHRRQGKGKFTLTKDERTARQSKLSSLQAELSGILFGGGENGDEDNQATKQGADFTIQNERKEFKAPQILSDEEKENKGIFHASKKRSRDPAAFGCAKDAGTNLGFTNLGFATGTGKQVKISAQALAAARKFMDGLDADDNATLHGNTGPALKAVQSDPEHLNKVPKQLCTDNNSTADTLLPALAALPPDYLPLDSRRCHDFQFIQNNGVRVGWGEFRARLLASGASADKVTEAWVRNHYRWIVWKLARMSLAQSCAPKKGIQGKDYGQMSIADAITALTPIVEHRLFQRYQNGDARPSILQMMERNPSTAVLVLLVASVQYPVQPQKKEGRAMLELTDGWDVIQVECDDVLTNAVRKTRIFPGMKLRWTAASLCLPHLLTANSTSIAPPATRLGLHPIRMRFLPLSLVSSSSGGVTIKPNPTPFGRGTTFLVVVLRRYPVLYWNRLPSGIYVFQTRKTFVACQKMVQQRVCEETEAVGSQVRADEVTRCAEFLKQHKSLAGAGEADKIEMIYAAMVTGQDSVDVLTEGLTAAESKQLEDYVAARRAEVESHVAKTVEERCGISLSYRRHNCGGVMEATSYLVSEVLHASLPSGVAVARGERHPERAVITVWRPAKVACDDETFNDDSSCMQEGGVYAISGLDLSPTSYVNQWLRDDCVGDALRSTMRPVLPDTLLQLHGSFMNSKNNAERMKCIQIAPSLAYLSPRVLIGRAMPRATPGLDGMPAIASAFTWIQNSSCDQNVFDFTGLLVRAGPIHHQPMNRLYPHYQWVFFADPLLQSHLNQQSNLSCEQERQGRPWMLAVRLQGTRDAVDWFDLDPAITPSEHVWVTLQDLEYVARDDTARAWRAIGGQHSVVKIVTKGPQANESTSSASRLLSTLIPAAKALLGC